MENQELRNLLGQVMVYRMGLKMRTPDRSTVTVNREIAAFSERHSDE